jgi:hypothetical protein
MKNDPDRKRCPRREPGLAAVAGGLFLAVLAVSLPTSAGAQSQWDVLLHGSLLSYGESNVKEDGFTGGFYGTFGANWRHLVEVGATRTRIDYLDGSRLQQNDLAAAYSLFGARASARVGGHLVDSSDPLSDGGLVLFGGANLYKVGVWSLGAEGAWSTYGDYGAGLDVTQLVPTAGLTLANDARTRFLGLSVKGYFIRLSEDTGLGSQDFASAEATLSFTAGPITLSGFGWGGEQAFAVRNSGFLVYNLSELHTGGYGGGLRWVVSPRAALSAGVYFETFQDVDLSGDATERSFALSMGFTL